MSPMELVNLGKAERNVRFVAGIVLLIAAAALFIYFVTQDVGLGWRLLLFPLTYQGVRFLFDGRTGICPGNAELGRDKRTDPLRMVGREKIADAVRASEIRRISRRGVAVSFGIAIVVTAAAMLL